MNLQMIKYWVTFSIMILIAPNVHSYGLKPTYYGEFGTSMDAKNNPNEKLVEFGTQYHYEFFETEVGFGGWAGSSHLGTKTSPYLQFMGGVEPRSQNMYMHYLVGPAFILWPDSVVASTAQVAHELGVGFMDERGCRVGVAYKHYSNGGAVKPNLGRDYLVIQAAF